MVRKRFDTTGTPFEGTRQEAKPAYRTRGGVYGAGVGTPAGYGRGPRQGRRVPGVPALPPGYSYGAPQYAPQYASQYALPPGYAGGPVVVQAAPLPALHGQPAAAVVPASLAAPAGPAPLPQGYAPAAVAWSWRHRWGLTPVVAPVVLAAGTAGDPGSTTWAAGLAAVGLWAWARRGRPVRGRMLLSRRERTIAAAWCAVAAAWAPVAAWGPLTPTAEALLLMAGVAWPSGTWWASRRVRPAEVVEDASGLSEIARQLIAAWPTTVGVTGPKVLHGSRIDPDSMREPAAGAWTCQIELHDDVHGETATGEDVRRGLERMLRLPVGCVQLATVREDSGRITLTMTPARHLEAADGVPWPGPVLTDDGRIPLAATPDGDEVAVRLYNDSGIEHLWINGSQGGGKTCTSYVVMLPGVVARKEVVIYVDGGRGTSIPEELRPALARVATTPDQWRAAVDVVAAIMGARQERRGAAGQNRWRMADGLESDPIVTLWIEEATGVGRQLTKRQLAAVAEMLEQGRKLGIRVVQVTQGTRADLLIGGTPARANLKTVIAHRPGGGGAARLAMDGTAEELDLLKLPPQEGWAAVVRNGAVLGFPCRVRFAREEAVAEALQGIVARQLDGADLAAAGAVYVSLPTGAQSVPTNTGDVDQGDQVDERAAAVTVVGVRDVDELNGADAVEQAPRPALYVVPAIPTQGTPAATPASVRSVADVVEDQGEEEGPAAVRAANRAAVLALLIEAGPLPRAEIVRRTGLSRTTVGRILRDDLAQAGDAEPAGDGNWRALTDTVSA